jgi:precorrin-2 C(20)-methyltransferase
MIHMTSSTKGRFWAVGVGPGSPELLTIKAVNVVKQADVICHAGPTVDRGRALETVQSFLRPGQRIHNILRASMTAVSSSDWRREYAAGVEQIAADCRDGRNVVFITEGDPTLYSTAARVWQLLAELHPDIPIELVPGVSSITAAAARVQWPLAQKDEPLLIVPAGYHADHLAGWIDQFPTVCLLKPSKALPRLVQTLAENRSRQEAVYVENVGAAHEWITHDITSAVDRGNYFSLVIVRSAHDRRTNESDDNPTQAQRTGQVDVIGIGPGDPSLLTGQALSALQRAEVIIGYEGYVRLLAQLGLRAEMIGHPLGAEAERCRQALDMAANGKQVALVSSGDAGVYGLASLLLELVEQSPAVAVEVIPGVTAASAAAALLGAPLGHDFCCISLSDLLTPWETIERRLQSAAQGDFVVVLYNPLSQRRTWQLPQARQILMQHRSSATPVGLVDKAHRPGMRVWHTTLGELTTEGIGMETTLIVGNSQTRMIHGRMVTPRGFPQASAERQPPVGADGTGGSRPPLALAQGIMDESFAIIERELGPQSLPAWAFAVVRRMIHASADFEFARTLRYSTDFAEAVQQALRRDALAIVTDTEMVLQGILTAGSAHPGIAAACLLNDAEVRGLAESAGITRSAAGIRIAARRHPSPLLVIGNAPTALDEAVRLVEQEGWPPAAIIGMPVGFVGVEEAKGRLLAQTTVPYLTSIGRKGGSAVAAAAVNALLECGPLRENAGIQ